VVLAFPKPDKSQALPTNYRPISLLSILSKVFEKVIHAQICSHLHTENIIVNEQFGFKRKHSTVAQLLSVPEHFAFEINKYRNIAMLR